MSTEITTSDELDALPIGSVVNTRIVAARKVARDGLVFWACTDGGHRGAARLLDMSPVTVIYRPDVDPAERDRQVAEQALRDAAGEYGTPGMSADTGYVRSWLLDRADRIARADSAAPARPTTPTPTVSEEQVEAAARAWHAEDMTEPRAWDALADDERGWYIDTTRKCLRAALGVAVTTDGGEG